MKAYLRLVEHNDIDAILYLFEDSQPVAGLQSQKAEEAYRLVYFPSFNNDVLVTVTVENEKAWLNLRVSKASFTGAIMNHTMQLSKEQLEGLRKVVDENRFWERVIPKNTGGRDGFTIAIEAKRNETYHAAVEWCPKGDIYNIWQYVIKLSGYDLNCEAVY